MDHDGRQELLSCQSCEQDFPIIFGIPDLRIFPDPYISILDDRKKGLAIAERFDDLSFPELVEFYYRTTTVVPPHHAKQYTRGLLGAVGRAKASLEMWDHSIDIKKENSPSSMLEIGCGTAPLLIAAAQKFQKFIGVDIAFRWLIVGKKRLMEAGLDFPLICACAEALPFPPQTFDRVIAESTIEMVKNQPQAIKESYRVLKAGGYFFLSTPNQFSIGPDPHVGIFGGRLFPKIMACCLCPKARWNSAKKAASFVFGVVETSCQWGISPAFHFPSSDFLRSVRTVWKIYENLYPDISLDFENAHSWTFSLLHWTSLLFCGPTPASRFSASRNFRIFSPTEK